MSEARAAAVLAEAIHAAECEAYTHEGRNSRCERSARAGASALAVAGLLADPAATAADGGLRAAIEALCDEAEYVVLAVDDPGCPPVKAVAEIDLRAALAATDQPCRG